MKILIALIVFFTIVGSIYYAPYLNEIKIIVIVLFSASALAVLNISSGSNKQYATTLIVFGIILSWVAFYANVIILFSAIILTMVYVSMLHIIQTESG